MKLSKLTKRTIRKIANEAIEYEKIVNQDALKICRLIEVANEKPKALRNVVTQYLSLK